MIVVRDAQGAADVEEVRRLFLEYQAAIGVDLCFQGFAEEVATLPGCYARPAGRLLLAVDDDSVSGCVALRPLEGLDCEMKRLYVRPSARGRGVGRLLTASLLNETREAGYARICLDTLPSMVEAQALYRSLGFVEVPPYCYNPIAGTSYMALSFKPGPCAAGTDADVCDVLKRWWLTGWAALVLSAMAASIVTVLGVTPRGMQALLRATARTSLVLFLVVFAASPARIAWPGAASRWLLDNRRYVGVSFAVSHAIHLAAIIGLAVVARRGPAWPVAVLGSVGYLFIAAMTATSFDRTAVWLGAWRWKRLHTAGLYYLWVIFTVSFLGSSAHEPVAAAAVAALTGALVFRLWFRATRRGEH